MLTPQALPDQPTLRAARVVLTVNLALMTLQVTTGWLTGSQAIVADGVHTFVDLIVDAILLASLKPRAFAYPAWLPSSVIAMLLMLTGGELLWQGIDAYADAPDMPTSVQLCALVAAVMVIIARECVARHLSHVSDELDDSQSDAAGLLAAGAWHARIDAISAGAAAVGALGTLAGIAHLDQIATLVIGGMMLCMGLCHEGSFVRVGYRLVR
jgi:divalent metal cation (Fe/Co/Zn/Cd) transporter